MLIYDKTKFGFKFVKRNINKLIFYHDILSVFFKSFTILNLSQHKMLRFFIFIDDRIITRMTTDRLEAHEV